MNHLTTQIYENMKLYKVIMLYEEDKPQNEVHNTKPRPFPQ